MKILFVNPLDRGEDLPRNVPFEIATLASIADSAGHKLDVMDLNVYREMNTNEAILDAMKFEKQIFDYELVWTVSSFRALAEAKRVINLIRSKLPEAVTVLAGSAATAAPRGVLKLVEGLDVAVFGDQEDTFLEVIERVPGQRWEPIRGVAFHGEHGSVRQNAPRPPTADLDSVPLPKYRFVAMDRYFQFSPMTLCQEALMCKRRLSFSWQRQHVDDSGKTVARFPSPRRAVDNIVAARFKYAIDFATLVDQDITTSAKWFKEFVDAYMEEGLHEIVPWSCWVDPGQIAKNPDIVRTLKDASCRAILMEVAGTTEERQDTYRKAAIELFKRAGIGIILRYVVGAPSQTVDDFIGMAFLSFSNKIDPYEVLPPNLYPDGPYYDKHKQEILQPYSGDLSSFLSDDSRNNSVSWTGGFDFPDVAALKSMVRTRDLQNLLRFAHRRGWGHSKQWNPHCPVCESSAVEGRAVAKASKVLHETVSQSRIPPLSPSGAVKA